MAAIPSTYVAKVDFPRFLRRSTRGKAGFLLKIVFLAVTPVFVQLLDLQVVLRLTRRPSQGKLPRKTPFLNSPIIREQRNVYAVERPSALLRG